MTAEDTFPPTIFLVFVRRRGQIDNFYKAFYAHEKAQECCGKMRKKIGLCDFVVREEEIE